MTNMIRLTAIIATSISISACLGGTGKNNSGDRQSRALDLNERALISAEKGDSRLAMQMLDDAMKISASLDDQDGKARALLNMARIARKKGDTKSASASLDKALALNSNNSMLADVNQEKAIQELMAGNIESAASWAEKAMATEPGDLKGRRLNLMARISFKAGNLDQSINFLEQAIAANSSDILKEELANSLRLLGIINTRKGLLPKASEYLDKALLIDKSLELPSKIAEDLEAIAEIYGSKGDVKRKEDFQMRAKSVRESIAPRMTPTIHDSLERQQ